MEILFELPLDFPTVMGRPSTQDVYEFLKRAIIEGTIGPGTKLPPTRSAGRHFRLSRNTIVSIYERLTNEGLVTSRRGSGTFVGAPGKRRPVHSQRLEGHSVELNEKIRRVWTDGS